MSPLPDFETPEPKVETAGAPGSVNDFLAKMLRDYEFETPPNITKTLSMPTILTDQETGKKTVILIIGLMSPNNVSIHYFTTAQVMELHSLFSQMIPVLRQAEAVHGGIQTASMMDMAAMAQAAEQAGPSGLLLPRK